MDISEESVGSVCVIRVTGRLDSTTAQDLEKILPVRVQGSEPVVADLSAVPYVSSAGLRVLLKSAKGAKAAGNRIVLTGLSSEVTEVFDISGFTAIFTIRPTLAEGLAALG